jgi:predicted ATPase
MQLISDIAIKGFRSLNQTELHGFGDFTALAGLNNSGKSNVLRALNAFFTGYTDGESRISIDADFTRAAEDKPAKKRKRIRIAVRFSLPATFKFRRDLEAIGAYLGNNFEIAKEWDRSRPQPNYFLNGIAVPTDDRTKIETFLALISFRYIPNRVLPLDVIRREHQALRDVLARRLSRRGADDRPTFEALQAKSADLIKHLSRHMSKSCPDVASVRLAMPESWADMAFAFGYRLVSGDIELDDSVQGSGVQSMLMLETLSLIDRDYFQQFGWKQASVWAVEEPESSLHSSLEAVVSRFLSEICTEKGNRLQLIATTHSDVVLQYADRGVLVSKQDNATILSGDGGKREVLERAASSGISRWVHPILASPLEPVLLVEGKSDCEFVRQALGLLEPGLKATVSYLELLMGGPVTGGVSALLSYVKENIGAIKARLPQAPVLIVLDWDSANEMAKFQRQIGDSDRARVLVWPETTFNPRLSKAFRGLERHLTDRIIDAADGGQVGTKRDGTRTIAGPDLGDFKQRVLRVLQAGVTMADLEYARPFILELAKVARGQ